MDLILWRHAEAADTHPDMERMLTAKGQIQAAKSAEWLKPRIPGDTRILVSPAKRTQQTAAALGVDFSTLNSLGPGASAQAILEAADWPKAGGCVLIIGHQPTLGLAAAYALTGRNQYWSVRKSAVWWLTRRLQGEDHETILRAVMTPDLI
jgi:phosphohistidine phosphatase